MFAKCPENYSKLHKQFARQGSRVLALGYRKLDSTLKNVNVCFFFPTFFGTLIQWKIKTVERFT